MFLLNPRTTSPRRCPQSIPVNWVLSMWRRSVSALSPSWSAKLLILSLRKRPATFWRKLISASCICDRGDTEISTDWDRVQPLSNRLVPEPKLCLQVSPTISSWYLSTSRTSSAFFPSREGTYHATITSLSSWGSTRVSASGQHASNTAPDQRWADLPSSACLGSRTNCSLEFFLTTETVCRPLKTCFTPIAAAVVTHCYIVGVT